MQVCVRCFSNTEVIESVAELVEEEVVIENSVFRRAGAIFTKKVRQLHFSGINFKLKPQETYGVIIIGEIGKSYLGQVSSFDTTNGFVWIMYLT
jgi:hypothetical protein